MHGWRKELGTAHIDIGALIMLGGDPAGAIALAVVAAFLLLTIGFQYRPWADVLGRFDRLRLLPRWTFFAPNPAMRDGHVLVRHRLSDGSESEWTYLEIASGRDALDPIWNPSKRPRKVVSDCINSIKLVRARAKDDGVLKYYIPYLTLLNLAINSHDRPEDCAAVQFSIVETSGRSDRRIWIYYVSEFHPVAGGA